MTNQTTKFEINKTYKWKSYNTCEQTHQYEYKYYQITKRTEKTIWWRQMTETGMEYSFSNCKQYKIEGRSRIKFNKTFEMEEISINQNFGSITYLLPDCPQNSCVYPECKCKGNLGWYMTCNKNTIKEKIAKARYYEKHYKCESDTATTATPATPATPAEQPATESDTATPAEQPAMVDKCAMCKTAEAKRPYHSQGKVIQICFPCGRDTTRGIVKSKYGFLY